MSDRVKRFDEIGEGVHVHLDNVGGPVRMEQLTAVSVARETNVPGSLLILFGTVEIPAMLVLHADDWPRVRDTIDARIREKRAVDAGTS